MLLGESERHIRDQAMNAEWAVSETLTHVSEIFAHIDDPFFRERGSDVEHVGDLLLRMLAGEEGYEQTIEDIPRGAIVVADNLSPAEALAVARRSVSAFVLDPSTAALPPPGAMSALGIIMTIMHWFMQCSWRHRMFMAMHMAQGSVKPCSSLSASTRHTTTSSPSVLPGPPAMS